MPHSTVSDLGLYSLSRQDVSGKYYHCFIAKVTVSFFLSDVKRPWLHVTNFFHAFLSSADVFILLYFFFCFFFKNVFFFQEEIKIKIIKQLQSSPDQILFVQPDLGPNCMLML